MGHQLKCDLNCNLFRNDLEGLQNEEQCALSPQSFAAASNLSAFTDRDCNSEVTAATSNHLANEASQIHIVQDLQKLMNSIQMTPKQNEAF